MSDTRPPSEVELKYALEIYGNCDLLTRIINEVTRLRVLCKSEADKLVTFLIYARQEPGWGLNDREKRLRAASEGKL